MSLSPSTCARTPPNRTKSMDDPDTETPLPQITLLDVHTASFFFIYRTYGHDGGNCSYRSIDPPGKSPSQSGSAMKLGSSPWQRYSCHSATLIPSQPPLPSRKMSCVKVDPDDPMNTFDSAQIVLSSIAYVNLNKHWSSVCCCLVRLPHST